MCAAHSEAMSPADGLEVKQASNSLVALLAVAVLTMLAAVSAALLYWRSVVIVFGLCFCYLLCGLLPH